MIKTKMKQGTGNPGTGILCSLEQGGENIWQIHMMGHSGQL